MSGWICLQGGAEFGPDCLQMDAELVDLAGGGPVVVLPLAGRLGAEYDTAGRNGSRHFVAAGGREVEVAPDPRSDPAGALAVLRRARLLVLPGGSPSRLRAGLSADGITAQVAAVLARGGVLMGASAGAMLLCAHTLLPESGGSPVAAGLGLVPASLVRPHWSGGDLVAPAGLPPGVVVLGLPECSGVLVDKEGGWTAVGVRPVGVRDGAGLHVVAPGERWPP